MANLAVQKETPAAPVQRARTAEWDPFRVFENFLRSDPFRMLGPIARFDESLAVFSPAFEIKESNEAFVFKADVPGVKQGDIEVSVSGNRLSIKGKREAEKEQKGDTYHTYERSYGSFQRTFTLPEGADLDKVDANLDNGVMTLTVPKRAQSKTRTIELKSGPKS